MRAPRTADLDRTFEALVFDWDGTAVPDRSADATEVRGLVEQLCAGGAHVVVVSGTHVGNVDGQLAARPTGPGSLHLCLNRGSEVFEVDGDGPHLVWQRSATEEEDAHLDRAAELVVQRLAAHGLVTQVVSSRLNRRKIDLIPVEAWADPPKARFAELLEAVEARLDEVGLAGIAEVVTLAVDAARDAGLADPRITSDAKHVEVGLTDKTDSGRWAARWLAQHGITGGLILVGGDEMGPVAGVAGSDSLMLVPDLARALALSVGPEPGGVPPGVLHLGGGPAAFVALLEDQVRRREQRRVPWIDEDPAWVVPLPSEPALLRNAESIGSLANGWVGLRGAREEEEPGREALFVANGVYAAPNGEGDVPTLLPGPLWTSVPLQAVGRGRRLLDLRTGVLVRRGGMADGLRSVRFVSVARPAVLGLRLEVAPANLGAPPPLAGADPPDPPDPTGPWPVGREEVVEETPDGVCLIRATDPGGAAIAIARTDDVADEGPLTTVQRVATWSASTSAPAPSWDRLRASLAEAAGAGFDGLLAEHRAAWARRWERAEVCVEGNPEDELAARFAVFHLLGAAPDAGEAAVGPRGLTGAAYGGHVFWDADVYVLPALAALHPPAARAMVEYRIRRLPMARTIAADLGRAGARFPWESAGDGSDVTPRVGRGRDGEPVPILTADHEEHIVADVAWAACHVAGWTGDDDLLRGPGRDLVLDTARYWASRVRWDGDARAHIDQVMGPDEYHEVVDDNAFTNVMARWNLRRAADLVEADGDPGGEAEGWRHVADALVDGWDGERGLHEQFAGYFDLEPLLVSQVAEPPVAADVVLGQRRIAQSQIVKQADVLMLHHMVPEELGHGSLQADLDFYGPRTAHGSSLSPAIFASMLARAGRPDEALDLFRLAARLDLDDLTGTTAGGLHLATMGGTWQALAFGFLGLRAEGEGLAVNPSLPGPWDALSLRFTFRGVAMGVRATHDRVAVSCDSAVAVRVGPGPLVAVGPPGQSFDLDRRSP